MGLGKWVPRIEPAKNRAGVSMVHVMLCQLPVTEKELNLRIRNSYFGNTTFCTVCSFET